MKNTSGQFFNKYKLYKKQKPPKGGF